MEEKEKHDQLTDHLWDTVDPKTPKTIQQLELEYEQAQKEEIAVKEAKEERTDEDDNSGERTVDDTRAEAYESSRESDYMEPDNRI